MKKFSGKFIASVFTAAVVTSFATVMASAVDYTDDPGYTTPETPAEVVTEENIAAALEQEEPVVYVTTESVTVKEDAIGAIANSEKPVTFVSETYSVTVDPAKITEVKAINLAMDITATEEEDTVDGVAVPAGAIVIAPAQTGDFGMTLEVTIPAASLANIDTEKAVLYYVADDGSVTKMEDALSFDEDGNAIISISHASKYVISETEIEGTDNTTDTTPGSNDNPNTGIVLPVALAALAGGTVVASAVAAKKRK